MKRKFDDTIAGADTSPFKEVAVDFKESLRARAHLAKTFPLLERKPALEQAAQLPSASLVIRVEAAYDPGFARENKRPDNICRRYICVKNPLDFVSKAELWPSRVLSFHEVLRAETPVKPWFDLDGFDIENHTFHDMIQFFQTAFTVFFKTQYNRTLVPDNFRWCESTQYDDEPADIAREVCPYPRKHDLLYTTCARIHYLLIRR